MSVPKVCITFIPHQATIVGGTLRLLQQLYAHLFIHTSMAQFMHSLHKHTSTHTHTLNHTHSVGAVGQSQSPAAVVVYETVGDVVGASTTGPHTIENVAYAVSDTPSTTPNLAYGHLSQDKK